MPQAVALHDTAALRTLEARAATHFGGDDFALMRRAGEGAWRAILRHWPNAHRIVVACGPGNNGGDGLVLAQHARQAGRDVVVVHAPGLEPRSALARQALAGFAATQGRLREFDGSLPQADLVVDALFGIGLQRAPDTPAAALIEAINAHGAPVLAIDVPSGVDGDRGSVPGAAVRATRTLEFLAPHVGLRTGAALDCTGAIDLDPLDVPAHLFDAVAPVAFALDAGDLGRWLAPRRRDSHKGRHGRVLCIGGDTGSGGAIILAAAAALRSGAGLVDVATRHEHVGAALARCPELMVHGIDEPPAHLFELADVLAVGPGLGRQPWGRRAFDAARGSGTPAVFDADALNLLAETPARLGHDCVLTPHPGEAARLLGCAAADIQADRPQAARRLAARYDAVVVLKGAGSIVAAPGRPLAIIRAGNPGMAVGGMGDLLTGVIAALRAQGLEAFDAARCGTLLHAAAGDAAAGEGGARGMLPTDLLPHLRRLANPETRA